MPTCKRLGFIGHAPEERCVQTMGVPELSGAESLRLISPPPWPVAPCELLLPQIGQVRGIVRGQTLTPRETGKRTFLDVVGGGWHCTPPTRRGERAFPVCPQSGEPDLFLIVS